MEKLSSLPWRYLEGREGVDQLDGGVDERLSGFLLFSNLSECVLIQSRLRESEKVSRVVLIRCI
jgi:hypothetical protein